MHNIHKREETKRVEAESLAAQISGKSLVIEVKAGEGGKLFGSVTPGMVADALAAQLGVDVDRRRLDLHGHIKAVGEHTIDVRIYENVTAQITLNVVPEGGAPVAAAPAAEAAAPEVAPEAEQAEEAPEVEASVEEAEEAEPTEDEA